MAAAIVLIIAAASLLIPRAGYYLTLRNKDSGELYARYRMDEGDRFSITFKHSVNQYPLTDTFEISEGKIYAEECKYYAYGAGVQVELNPGEELSYTDDGAMLITGIHQDRTGVCYAVATVYDEAVGGGGELFIVVHTAEAERAAHEHDALHAEVEVAGLFRQDLAERTEQQRGAVGDGGDDEGDKQSHSLAASFSVFDERKMSR